MGKKERQNKSESAWYSKEKFEKERIKFRYFQGKTSNFKQQEKKTCSLNGYNVLQQVEINAFRSIL